MKITMVDVPSGWRYGFPRPYPGEDADPNENFEDWFRNRGYPDWLIKQGMLKYCRYFDVEDTEDGMA